jgi:hypothetical protein
MPLKRQLTPTRALDILPFPQRDLGPNPCVHPPLRQLATPIRPAWCQVARRNLPDLAIACFSSDAVLADKPQQILVIGHAGQSDHALQYSDGEA